MVFYKDTPEFLAKHGINQSLFEQYKLPYRGITNPHNQSNVYWQALIIHGLHAYHAANYFNEDYWSDANYAPLWSFGRYGKSRTDLPDGTIIYIAGEHEDFYDRNFYIYNDVIVVSPEQEVTIYGYPTEVFPATDFHSATLINDDILIIGRLGYQHERATSLSKIYKLNTHDFRIESLDTFGDIPPCIYGHTADYDEPFITIKGGNRLGEFGEFTIVENMHEWRLNTHDYSWTAWYKPNCYYRLYRTDLKLLHLCYFEPSDQFMLDDLGFVIDEQDYLQRYVQGLEFLTPLEKEKDKNGFELSHRHQFKLNSMDILVIEEYDYVDIIFTNVIDTDNIQLIKQTVINNLSQLLRTTISVEIIEEYFSN